jgi:hypothetical protein
MKCIVVVSFEPRVENNSQQVSYRRPSSIAVSSVSSGGSYRYYTTRTCQLFRYILFTSNRFICSETVDLNSRRFLVAYRSSLCHYELFQHLFQHRQSSVGFGCYAQQWYKECRQTLSFFVDASFGIVLLEIAYYFVAVFHRQQQCCSVGGILNRSQAAEALDESGKSTSNRIDMIESTELSLTQPLFIVHRRTSFSPIC